MDTSDDRTYQLSIERRPDFLVATVRGENSAETVMRYMQDIVGECERAQCFRVLIDEQLDGERLDVSDVFSVASEGAMNAMGIFQAIAYVDPKMGDMASFAETVAVNRGMPVKMFPNIAAAELWLQRQKEGTDEKDLFEQHNSRNQYQ